jgi:hypothetical protein
MADTIEKYNLGDKYLYIDMKGVKKSGDLATLSFQGQKKAFTVRVPEAFHKEIKNASFSAEQTFLLIATEAITSYHNVQLSWGIAPELRNQAFTWMLISDGKMSLQPLGV